MALVALITAAVALILYVGSDSQGKTTMATDTTAPAVITVSEITNSTETKTDGKWVTGNPGTFTIKKTNQTDNNTENTVQ